MNVTGKLRDMCARHLLYAMVVVAITGCGGGSNPEESAQAQATGRAQALSASPSGSAAILAARQPEFNLAIESVRRMRETRIGRSIFEYTFRVDIKNNGDSYSGVVAQLEQVGAGSVIVDGRVAIGESPAASVISANDTVTIRHDRSVPFDATAWRWSFSGQATVMAVEPGGVISGSLGVPTLQGTTAQMRLDIRPIDRRNGLLSTTISNSTPGGAVPSITNTGLVTWTPNLADFDTQHLLVGAQFSDSSSISERVNVRVVKARPVATIEILGAGLYSDPLGRYVIEILPTPSGVPAGSNIVITEFFDLRGKYEEDIRVSPVELNWRVRRSPVQPANAGLLTAQRTIKSITGKALNNAVPVQFSTGLPTELEDDNTTQDMPYGNLLIPGQALRIFSPENRVDQGIVTARTNLTPLPGSAPFNLTRATIAKIQSNCTIALDAPLNAQCESLPGTPVILLHGFAAQIVEFSDEGRLGGGKDTWGNLAFELKRRGHPVFELRWNTKMRFEEAAGLLSRLVRSVAEGTGRKPLILAHSFGGLVAHSLMAGHAAEWSEGENKWVLLTPATDLVEGVVTLASPLSGVNAVRDRPFVIGRDEFDRVAGLDIGLTWCRQITCIQAGLDIDTNVVLKQLPAYAEIVGALPLLVAPLNDPQPLVSGETVTRLKRAWDNPNSALSQNASRFTTVVTLRSVPKDRVGFGASTAYHLGDALISLAGQAVRPLDLMGQELAIWRVPEDYPLSGWMSSLPGLAPDLFSALNNTPAASNWMLKTTSNGREYYFARRAGHTTFQANKTIVTYRSPNGECQIDLKGYAIAFYDTTVTTDLNGCNTVAVRHPLTEIMDAKLKRTNPTPVAPPAVNLAISGSVVLASGPPANGVFMSLSVIDDTGAQTGALEWIRVLNGRYAFNAAQLIRNALSQNAPDYSKYSVRIMVGDGVNFLEEIVKVGSWANLSQARELPAITLRPVIVGQVFFTGVVRDIAGAVLPQAVVRMARGVNLSFEEVQAQPNSAVSARYVTDSQGRFGSVSITPGDYTIWVSGPDHLAKVFSRSVASNSYSNSPLEFGGIEEGPEPARLISDWRSVGDLPMGSFDRVSPKVKALRSGLVGVSWLEQRLVPPGVYVYEVKVRFFSQDGNPVTPIQQVSTPGVPVEIVSVSLTTLPNGGAVLVWFERGFPAGPRELKFLRFESNGLPSGSPIVIAVVATTDRIFGEPGVSVLEDGSFAVFWNLGLPSTCKLLAKFYSDAGVGLNSGQTVELFPEQLGTRCRVLGANGHSGNRYAVVVAITSGLGTSRSRVLTISREGQVVGIADDTLHNPLLERFNLDRVTIQARNESGFALLWTSGQDTADGNSHTSRVHFRLFDSSAVPASTEVVLHEGLNTLLGEIQESYLGRNRKAELVKVAEGWHVLWAGIRFSPISPFELDRTTLHARSVNVQGHVTALGSTSDRGRQDCSYFWGNIVRQNVLLLGCGYIQNVSLNGKNLSRRYSTSLIPPARIANRLFFVREVFPFPGSLPNRDLQLSVIAVQE